MLALAVGLSWTQGTAARAAEKAGAPAPKPSETKRVREPAVAGLFYPKAKAELEAMLDRYLASAKTAPVQNLRALVVPHAGYRYSGPTAAHGYKLLSGSSFQTVVVLAPSHYAAFEGACVSGADEFRTPLGAVPIAPLARELAKTKPFVPEAPCRVGRPQWAMQSSRPLPAAGADTPDTWEHADEVQVPFLQRVLKEFALVPIVFGEVDPAEVARGLAGRLDEQTLLVTSSDLSHYHPYDKAKELDTACVRALCALDVEQLARQEACGKVPILALLHLARLKGWTAHMLDYRNSGDTAGDKSGVVGYAAVAFCAPGKSAFTPEDRRALLKLARQSVTEVVTQGRLPEVQGDRFPARLAEAKGCFVTLTKRGALRGCIGNIMPQGPLWTAVMENARSAAARDFRFPPVQKEEVDKLEIEISVLTVPQPLAFSSPDDLLAKLQPHRDGVVLHLGPRSATYLPQVWEQLPDKTTFLNSLAQKAGCAPDEWRKPGVKVMTYQVEAFKEADPAAGTGSANR
jgi:AmmeMemoRadiSam system protein B/AmmeMemoRadiSam system protein A